MTFSQPKFDCKVRLRRNSLNLFSNLTWRWSLIENSEFKNYITSYYVSINKILLCFYWGNFRNWIIFNNAPLGEFEGPYAKLISNFGVYGIYPVYVGLRRLNENQIKPDLLRFDRTNNYCTFDHRIDWVWNSGFSRKVYAKPLQVWTVNVRFPLNVWTIPNCF